MITVPSSAVRVEAWLDFIEKREQWLHDAQSFEIAEEHQLEFQAVYAICAQAIRYAGAYVVLYRAGRSREAVAVARQALEHALTAQWAHFEESGPDQLVEGYRHTSGRALSAVSTFLDAPQDEVDEALGSMEGEGKRLLRVTTMIEQIDYNAVFATQYLKQSQVVHVTSDTVAAFLDLDDDKQFTVLSEAIDPNIRQTAHFTAMAAMFASWVLATLQVDGTGLTELDRRSDELALPLSVRD
ncbi:MAG: hypothetical protein ABS61_05620 [Microbacterium sp. SCN 70-18]|nr:hypothetical protein [Microbacterium chocolatum]ODT11060.1 MAG: hypothetical protein ABS61_05620 [Microbacterium sp. SCN 70-18]